MSNSLLYYGILSVLSELCGELLLLILLKSRAVA